MLSLAICVLMLAYAAATPVSTKAYEWAGSERCGDSAAARSSINSRIVGGQTAQPSQFPWQVSIQSSSGRHFCGGTLINQNWIVTAAHCISPIDQMIPSRITIAVGRHNVKKSKGRTHSQSANKIIVHEKYDTNLTPYDIALIQVKNPFPLGEDVHPACAPSSEDEKYYIMDEYNKIRPAAVSGWGSVNSRGQYPDELQWAKVPMIPKDECRNNYRRETISDDMICAGDLHERDACQGDSGGPLVILEHGHFELIGVVSWGYGCASGYPGIYASVPHFRQWITKNIK